MKYIILIGDGMSDKPIKELGYKTPLQKAITPNMDWIASKGMVGMVKTIHPKFAPGSDIAILSIFGYDPSRYYSGRASLEAAFRGIKLENKDIAYRCNLITLKFPSSKNIAGAVMEDFSAGHISSKEANILINLINRKLGNNKIAFYPGISYRHIMVWKGGKGKIQTAPPHDITNRKISSYLPKGNGANILRALMEKSNKLLLNHKINIRRIKQGLKPANSIWLWGQGKKPVMPQFKDNYGIKGSLISAVDLVKGIGVYAGFDIIKVKGATGYFDTNYLGKAKAALNALKKADLVCIHVEAPDEASHNGDIKAKIKAIENFDSKVVGTVLKGLKRFKDYRILLLPDHATPIKVRTHTNEPVPFAIYDSRLKRENRKITFDEYLMKRKEIMILKKGHKLMNYFIKGDS